MKLLDLNLLLYAVNRDSPHHGAAKAWLDATLIGDEAVGIPWVVVLGFLRLTTSARVFARPITPKQAVSVVSGWLAQPSVSMINPGGEHWRLLRDIITDTGTSGNLTTDAHLAALAIETGAELCSTDADFARFPHLQWTNPLR